MEHEANTGGNRRFSVGDSLSAASDVFGQNIWRFAGLCAVLAIVGTILTFAFPMGFVFLLVWLSDVFQWFGPEPTGRELQVVSILAGPILQPLVLILTLAYGVSLTAEKTVGDLRGSPVSFGPSMTTGFKAFLTVTGIGFVIWLGGLLIGLVPVLIGAALAGAGGFILLSFSSGIFMPALVVLAVSVLWLAVPIAVIEQRGVFSSIVCAASLSRDCRWTVVGVVLLVAFLSGIAVVAGGYLFKLATDLFEARYIGLGAVIPLAFTFGWVVTTSPAVYYSLREAKEGEAVLMPPAL